MYEAVMLGKALMAVGAFIIVASFGTIISTLKGRE
jgi:hypothetical protein